MSRYHWAGTPASGAAALAALALALCGPALAASRPAAAKTAAPMAEGARVARDVEALEARAYESWRMQDASFWRDYLSDRFVGWGPTGRLDKRAAARAFSGANCKIGDVAISDPEVSRLAPDVVVLTHKTTVDAVCDGARLPAASRTASGYLREAGHWRAVFRAESAIVDPAKLAPAAPAAPAATAAAAPSRPSRSDRGALTFLQQERAVWTAWMNHDSRRLQTLLPAQVQFIDIFGNHLATKAQAVKTWSGQGCRVKSFDLADGKATMLTPDVGILTQRATADGACYGQRVGPVWGSTFYVRRGGVWVWSFGINVPAKGGV